MKHFLLVIFAVFLSVELVFSQNVSVTDYQVPVSTAKNLFFNGSWDWAQSGDTVKSNDVFGRMSFRTFYSSLPFAWFLNGSASANRSYGKRWAYRATVSPEIRKYIWEDMDWFGFGSANVSMEREWDRPESDLSLGGGFGRLINATALAKAVRIEGHLLKEGVIKSYMPKETMIEIANIIERESEYKDLYGPTYEV